MTILNYFVYLLLTIVKQRYRFYKIWWLRENTMYSPISHKLYRLSEEFADGCFPYQRDVDTDTNFAYNHTDRSFAGFLLS